MRRAIIAAALASIVLVGPAGAAGDIRAGREKAQQCQTCHGLDGIAKIPLAANLAGQTKEYLLKSLDDFKKGIRKNEMMTIVIEPLSKEDMADLAAYYSAIKITVELPNE